MSTNYLALANYSFPTVNASSITVGSSINMNQAAFSTLTGSTINVSTLTGSTITGTTVFFSTMTASTILTAGSTINLARNVNVPNRFVEVGCDLADSMYLDFHSKDSALPDYSTRIISQGGATTGTGGLNMYASTIGLVATNGVGIGTTVPSAALHIKNATSAMRITGNLTNASTRPAATTTPGAFEIRGSGAFDASDDGFLRLSAGGGNAAYLQSYIDLTGYSTMADMDRNIIFGVAGAERMRINIYGFVGIGTTSPQMPLQLGAGLTTDFGGGLKTQYNQVTSITAASVRNGSDWASGGTFGGSGPYTWTTNVATGSYFTISTGITAGATYQVSITASGPAGSSFSFGYSSSITLTTTLTTYTGLAPNLTSPGLYVFIYGPSGTVFTFSNITFQRLDTLATGNMGIGTAAPATPLHVFSSSTGHPSIIRIQSNVSSYGSSANGGRLEWYNTYTGNGGSYFQAAIQGVDDVSGDSGYGGLAFITVNNTTQRESMRISSGGNVLIGTSATPYYNPRLTITNTGANEVININSDNPSYNFIRFNTTVTVGSAIPIFYATFYNNGGAIGQIVGSGSGLVAYNSGSDARIKKNIDYNFNGMSIINQLKPAAFSMLPDMSNTIYHGFIAQDVLPLYPQYVTTSSDGRYSMDYSKFSGIIVKGIQEQHATIVNLQSQVTAQSAQLDAQASAIAALEARLAAAGL